MEHKTIAEALDDKINWHLFGLWFLGYLTGITIGGVAFWPAGFIILVFGAVGYAAARHLIRKRINEVHDSAVREVLNQP